MKKILVLYFSGVGNTKMAVDKIRAELQVNNKTELYSVEKLPEKLAYEEFDAIVIGFPVYHCHPCEKILQFINKLEPLHRPVPLFLSATCGLYSANALRIFAKYCIPKNLIPIMNRVYRCAATDGSLLAPYMEYWFCHEKHLDRKIKEDCTDFLNMLDQKEIELSVPRFKLYSIMNYPNKWCGQHLTFAISLHKNLCIRCRKCVKNCPFGAVEEGIDGYPVFSKAQCGKCYRCIHHCPEMALSLSKKKTTKRVLSEIKLK